MEMKHLRVNLALRLGVGFLHHQRAWIDKKIGTEMARGGVNERPDWVEFDSGETGYHTREAPHNDSFGLVRTTCFPNRAKGP
jgi:hypothetical protein